MFEKGVRVQSKEGGRYCMETGTITHLHGDAKPDGDTYYNPIDGRPGMFWIVWDNPEMCACWMAERLLKPFPIRGDRVRYCADGTREHDPLHGLVGTVMHLHGDVGYDNGADGNRDAWIAWDENHQGDEAGWIPIELLRKV